MKKLMTLALALVLLTSFASISHAQTPADKLGRGLVNIVTALFELPGTMIKDGEENGVASGMTKGTVEGIVNVVSRALVGVYETATFPLAVPQDYEPILEKPTIVEVMEK